MEDKSELIKTFLMSVEFSDRDDIEINISKSSAGFYRIILLVSWLLFIILKNFLETNNSVSYNFTHSNLIEIIWTSIPAFILLSLASPSFSLLYAMDEIVDPMITLKIIGSQWYWSYEYSDFLNPTSESIFFDSYMILEEDLDIGQWSQP